MTDIATMLIEEKTEEIAKNALIKGLSIDIVSEITKLDIDKVKRMQEEINNK